MADIRINVKIVELKLDHTFIGLYWSFNLFRCFFEKVILMSSKRSCEDAHLKKMMRVLATTKHLGTTY